MKLYENVVIGNFLFGLGCAMGGRLRSGHLPAAVNLLQQTPKDKLLGDVLLSFPGTLRLIEFKAKGASLKKERTKHRKLSAAVEALPGMSDISRKVHWYIETAPSEVLGIEAFFGPYLDALAATSASRPRSALDFKRFIETTVDEVFAHRDEEVPEQVQAYLTLLRWCQGGDKTGAGALIVMVGAGGGLNYVELKDMTELRMEHRQWLAYRHELELALERERTLQRGLARGEPEQERSMKKRGPEHGI